MDSSQIFNQLILKTQKCLQRGRILDYNSLVKALEELNSLNYRYPIVRDATQAAFLVDQLCEAVPPKDEALSSKCLQLITKLLTTQNVDLKGETLLLAVKFCLISKTSLDEGLMGLSLKALEALARDNAQRVFKSEIIEDLLLTSQSPLREETILAALKCLTACTALPKDHSLSAPNGKILERCSDTFSSFLFDSKDSADPIIEAQTFQTCLLGLIHVIPHITEDKLKRDLGQFLGIVKSYMTYHVQGMDFIKPEVLVPSTLSVPEVPLGKEKIYEKKIRRRGRGTNKLQIFNSNSSSDKARKSDEDGLRTDFDDFHFQNSDGVTSDSDNADGGRPKSLTSERKRTRQVALLFFSEIIRFSDRCDIFAYWTSFVPDRAASGGHNLASCVLRDTSDNVKKCALHVLQRLITRCKCYIVQAELRDKTTTSFTTFCEMLGLTLLELHRTLGLALNERSSYVLIQAMKCLAALAQATPYHRMPQGMITKLIRNVKAFLYHKQSEVQVAAMIVMGSVVGLEPPSEEIKQAITNLWREELGENRAMESDMSDDFDYALFSSDEETDEATDRNGLVPWLLQRCLSLLGVNVEGLPGNDRKAILPVLKVECLQTLAVMSDNYYEIMLPYTNYIIRAMEKASQDKNGQIVLHASRTIHSLAMAIQKTGGNEGLNFWLAMLGGPLVALIQNDQAAAVRSTGCGSIARIGPHYFELLPRERQILCVTLLFGAVKDKETAGQAIRSLAFCLYYPSLIEDTGFVLDTIQAILDTMKGDVYSRINASWALATLGEEILKRTLRDFGSEDRIPTDVFLKLLETSSEHAGDDPRVVMNLVRATGNFLQGVDSDFFAQNKAKNLVLRSLNVLVDASTTATNVKVRWNACYAIANALKNPRLFDALDGSSWQGPIYTKLSELVVNYKNFKVRISVTVALSSPKARDHYGQYFIPVWTALASALDNCHANLDFKEYNNYGEQLIEHICLALGHLTALLAKEDLPQLEGALNAHADILKTNMHKAIDRLLPERSANLSSAVCALAILESRTDVIGEAEKRVLDGLKRIFVLQ